MTRAAMMMTACTPALAQDTLQPKYPLGFDCDKLPAGDGTRGVPAI